MLSRAVRKGWVSAVVVLSALHANAALAGRQGIGAVRIRRAPLALVALANGHRGIHTVGVDRALDAFIIMANGLGLSAVEVYQTCDAILRRELTERLSRIVAVGVGSASVMALAIHAAQRRRRTVGVDQAVVTLAIVEIAGGCRGAAIGVRLAFRALGTSRLAERRARRRRAIRICLASHAGSRGCEADACVPRTVAITRTSGFALVVLRKAGLGRPARGFGAALSTLAEHTRRLARIVAVCVGNALGTTEARRAAVLALLTIDAAARSSVIIAVIAVAR